MTRGGLALIVLAACGADRAEPGGTVRIEASFPGASATVVESAVVEPIEEAVNRLDRLVRVRGVARVGRATVDVTFERGVDRLEAGSMARAAVQRILPNLPRDVEPPTIIVGRPTSWVYAVIAPVDGERLQSMVETMDGVAVVETCGVPRPVAMVEVDPGRLAAYGVGVADVERALAGQHLDLPAGRVDVAGSSLTVRGSGRLRAIDDVLELAVDAQGRRVRDVAVVRLEDRPRCELYEPGHSYLRVGLRGGDHDRRRRAVLARLGPDAQVFDDGPVILDGHEGEPRRRLPVSPPMIEATLVGPDLDAMIARAQGAVATLRAADGIAKVWCASCEPPPPVRVERTIDGLDRFEVRLAAGPPVDVDGPAEILHLDRQRAVVVRVRGEAGTPTGVVRAALARALPGARIAPTDLRALEAEPW